MNTPSVWWVDMATVLLVASLALLLVMVIVERNFTLALSTLPYATLACLLWPLAVVGLSVALLSTGIARRRRASSP